MGILNMKKDERKKAHRAAQAGKISNPKDFKTSAMLNEESNTNNPTQQHARNPDASLNDKVYSSTTGHSTSHGHPNRTPQDASRSVPNNPHQASQASSYPAHHQQPAMNQNPAINAPRPSQSSTTGGPGIQDHTRSTKRNSGTSSSSRPSSAHFGASSVNNPPNSTAVTSQRGSRASSGSRHSSPPSSSDENPFKYDDGRYDGILK
ncbi:hypothetical protein BOTCAL_0070g00310 [Botryotinia calthae]|uniref:Uncharacterized protein n=1 Tax=Botryotinia calthae TaxID=38488 RepID=A0A4Y8D9E5_9HELO|nr:hypothetical protein BOTCAL_0070g00310 [Botryotinia calthae]